MLLVAEKCSWGAPFASLLRPLLGSYGSYERLLQV
jgi:hypothetical protein